jgi:bifunctional UDP-N-acetylglucosamine pyrophosphorylase/glucosamine-1-phosphate N-acetyltransferase
MTGEKMEATAVILAAGQSTRMKSNTPKVLHHLAGKPLIDYSLEAVAGIGKQLPIIVIGHGAESVREAVKGRASFIIQENQLGTAHAVQCAEKSLKGKTELVLVIYGDMPLLTSATLKMLITAQQDSTGPLSLLTMKLEDSHGFGRILRNPDGSVKEIIEEAQATPEQKCINELNVGAYCVRSEWLWDALKRIPVSPNGEYYLTDLVGLATGDGLRVGSLLLDDPSEAIGINNRIHLAEAEVILRKHINWHWMTNGVTFIDPERTYIDADVQIGMDTVIYPNTYLRGNTVIGQSCILGPDTIIVDTRVGNECKVLCSVLEKAELDDNVDMGPFCHLRKGAHLARHVHMGNFGEVKESTIGEGTKMGHFSYIGNAKIGKDVNIGAGTITCNFDGKNKHITEIGDEVFIGSDTMLVAPVKLGKRARTGAGAVVNKDVPEDTVVVGVPAKILRTVKEEEKGNRG